MAEPARHQTSGDVRSRSRSQSGIPGPPLRAEQDASWSARCPARDEGGTLGPGSGQPGTLASARMTFFECALTDRLDLRRPDPARDLTELFVIFSDPSGWWYDPAGRHTDPGRTREWLARAAARFEPNGLSYWTVRRRDNAVIIGVGGAQRQRTGAWNLNYRVAAAEQGQGFATELSRAAYSAASSLDSSAPFIAWIAPQNAPSRRVAERVELTNYGLNVDPSDGQQRLAYADRPVADLGLIAREAAGDRKQQ
jgi:ribosomal-protein-alanine N-acetyltransferase